ncbi:hypothetical protein J416_09454 [Gracilibacillus halophilus YIM-C55.5]|uniref:Uncharacterized protein n=1 Tax=Gracilibacillus halophilus YIM-C55.5 TaxID=1308866 RepID=N4W8T5_9BACI|nr:hypothetical protein [Gracilibacillus halophilus]ENH96713.1 hypothetical protein J416_09454 [Gracilibacillus halophilus YIM-C55.5]
MDVNQVIDVLVEQNKHFKDVLLWSIGGILTILFLFVGTNLYAVKKFRKDELDKITSDVKSELKESYLSNLKSEVIKDLELKLNEKVESYENKININEAKISDTKDEIKEINYNEKKINGKIYELEGDLWDLKGIDANALNYYIKAGILHSEYNKGNLNSILNKIEKNLDRKSELTIWDKSELNNLFESLPDGYATQLNSIVNKIEEK